jgi:DNA-binding CsgD family transcriptional regulator
MLTNADLKSILKVLQKLMIPCDLETFPTQAIAALPQVVRSDFTCWTPTNFSRRKLLWATTSSNEPAATKFLEVANRHFEEHPFGSYYFRTGDGTAHKLTDFLARNQIQRLEGLYQKTLRPLGLEDQMVTVLPNASAISSHPTGLNNQEEDIVIALHRSKSDFTERDRLVLNLVRPHLLQAYANAQVLTQTQQELAQLNQALEQSGTILLTHDLQVQQMTRRAWELLLQYFPVSSRSTPHLPENLLRWIQYQLSQQVEQDNIPSPCLPLRLDREEKRLVVRLIPDPLKERYLLLLQEELLQPFSAELLELLGLTKREAEVLFWVAKDQNNREIALLLGCSEKTVQKHLEHIYRKLGVQTRAGAIVCALKQLGILNH